MAVLSFLTYLRGIYKLNLNSSSRVHYAIIQSIYDCFIMAKEDMDLSRLEMCLSTATGNWLDHWGEYFSVYRKSEEADEHFSQRIIDSVIQPKSTIPAIKDNIVDYLNSTYHKDYTRDDVLIREPWKELAKYSHKGALSKDARFFSTDFYSHAILDINIPEEVSDDLVDLVKAVKAAGVKVLWSILNQYDIVSGFNNANDAWAAYARHIQTKTSSILYSGLMLSNSSPNPVLSGRQEIWFVTTSLYTWYAKMQNKSTDESIIITKKDLIGLVDYYESPTDPSEFVKITEETFEILEALDKWITLSASGRLSTSEGIMFEYSVADDVWKSIMKSIETFKQKNPEYYDSIQPPILNGERAMWYIKSRKNWLWNSPLMTMKDFYEFWEPFEGYDEHTINSIVEFEDAYYNGYLTFGDKYQPPIVAGKPFIWTPLMSGNYLFGSPAFRIEDLEQLYLRQFYSMGTVEKENVTLGDIIELETKSSVWGYSIIGDEQPHIEITTEDI